jgi:hypothetical protein
MINDRLQASIAAGLVQAGFSFQTNVGKSGAGAVVRIFQVPFELPREGGGASCVVTGYAAGPLLVAVSPLRITRGPFLQKRHEIADFVIRQKGMVRLFPDPQQDPTTAEVFWVEASIPVPSDGSPMDPFLSTAPFQAVAAAVDLIRDRYSVETAVPEELETIPIVQVDSGAKEPLAGG